MRMSKIAFRCLSEAISDVLARWLPYSRFNGEPAFSFYSVAREVHYGGVIMARKAGSGSRSGTGIVPVSNSEVRWQNVSFDETDIAVILEGGDNLPALADALAALLIGNGDFTLRYDAAKSEYQAFVISAASGADGGRIGISARAKTGLLAASAVFYKVMLLKSDPSRFSEGGQNLGIR